MIGQHPEFVYQSLTSKVRIETEIESKGVELADDCQGIDLKETDGHDRPAEAQVDVAFCERPCIDVFSLKLESAQVFQEVFFEKRQGGQIGEFVFLEAECADQIELSHDLREDPGQVGAVAGPVAAVEFPLGLNPREFGSVVERLHHRQLVQVGVEQRSD